VGRGERIGAARHALSHRRLDAVVELVLARVEDAVHPRHRADVAGPQALPDGRLGGQHDPKIGHRDR